ncbi:MAG TPA: FAD-dependent monooxygenase [Burkholderiaceae bacterium]|nr:FAD-dependent monooxygenase [Burkholderiaceae bacterium]
MSRVSRFDVVVAGRGAVGCAAALGLAQQGLSTLHVGVSPTPSTASWDPRVFAISPASMALLDRLRVAGQLNRSRLAPVYDMEIHGDDTRRPGRLGFSAYGACVSELATIVESRELQRVLQLGCSMQAQLESVDDGVSSIHFHDDHVEIVLDGSQARSVKASVLVGADGANSLVRTHVGITGKHRDYAQCGVVAEFEAERPHGDIAYQWFLGSSILALLPLPAHEGASTPSHRMSMVWSTAQAHATQLCAMEPERVAAEVERACGARLGALRAASPALAFDLHYFIADTLVQPRLALVGDAAHVMHPLAGQGMNAGLADVATLLDTIADRETFRDLGDMRLLRRYARARAADLALLMRTTDGLQRLFAFDDPFVRAVRNVGLNLVNRLPVFKNGLIRQAIGRSHSPRKLT